MVDLTPTDIAALLAAHEITLVDVREPAEFAAAHIAGAINHPLSSFNPTALPAGRVVLQCGIGKRSATALQACAAVGSPVTEHMAGGLQAWAAAGLPLTRA